MLELTVLRRYWENERKICDTIAIIKFEFEDSEENVFWTSTTTNTFEKKYSEIKEKIWEAINEEDNLDVLIKRIEMIGVKVKKLEFSGENDDIHIAVLLDETIPREKG